MNAVVQNIKKIKARTHLRPNKTPPLGFLYLEKAAKIKKNTVVIQCSESQKDYDQLIEKFKLRERNSTSPRILLIKKPETLGNPWTMVVAHRTKNKQDPEIISIDILDSLPDKPYTVVAPKTQHEYEQRLRAFKESPGLCQRLIIRTPDAENEQWLCYKHKNGSPDILDVDDVTSYTTSNQNKIAAQKIQYEKMFPSDKRTATRLSQTLSLITPETLPYVDVNHIHEIVLNEARLLTRQTPLDIDLQRTQDKKDNKDEALDIINELTEVDCTSFENARQASATAQTNTKLAPKRRTSSSTHTSNSSTQNTTSIRPTLNRYKKVVLSMLSHLPNPVKQKPNKDITIEAALELMIESYEREGLYTFELRDSLAKLTHEVSIRMQQIACSENAINKKTSNPESSDSKSSKSKPEDKPQDTTPRLLFNVTKAPKTSSLSRYLARQAVKGETQGVDALAKRIFKNASLHSTQTLIMAATISPSATLAFIKKETKLWPRIKRFFSQTLGLRNTLTDSTLNAIRNAANQPTDESSNIKINPYAINALHNQSKQTLAYYLNRIQLDSEESKNLIEEYNNREPAKTNASLDTTINCARTQSNKAKSREQANNPHRHFTNNDGHKRLPRHNISHLQNTGRQC